MVVVITAVIIVDKLAEIVAEVVAVVVSAVTEESLWEL